MPLQSAPALRVLVAEDETKIAVLLKDTLVAAGCRVEVAPDGAAALAKVKTEKFDVVALDLMLPRLDGLTVLKEMRSLGISTPVLILSARGEVGDRIEGLDLGADDYLSKPFVLAEVLARIRALSRRNQDQKATLQVADLELDPVKRTVKRGNQSIDLATREFKLLEYLMRSKGQICGRAAIIRHVWEYKFDPGTNLVDVYIMRVREKIDGDFDKKLLHTVRGIGYVLKEES